VLKEGFHHVKFWVLLAVGCFALAVGLLAFAQDWRYSHEAMRVEGTILSTTLSADKQKGYRWDLKVRYTDEQRSDRVLSVLSSSSTQYSEGMTIRLLVDPKDPNQARLDDGWDLWGPSVLALGVGTMVLGYLFL
jgi:hypothetical protein